MENPFLARLLLIIFRRALKERRFHIAELLLQAIEQLDPADRYDALVEAAYLSIDREARKRVSGPRFPSMN